MALVVFVRNFTRNICQDWWNDEIFKLTAGGKRTFPLKHWHFARLVPGTLCRMQPFNIHKRVVNFAAECAGDAGDRFARRISTNWQRATPCFFSPTPKAFCATASKFLHLFASFAPSTASFHATITPKRKSCASNIYNCALRTLQTFSAHASIPIWRNGLLFAGG